LEVKDLVGLAGVPVIMALVEVAKPWLEDQRYWPLVSITLGVLLNVAVAALLSSSVPTGALTGLVAGLAAAGLYSAGKQWRAA
jgi:hypothetical protein